MVSPVVADGDAIQIATATSAQVIGATRRSD
jgi:hypothetical protein